MTARHTLSRLWAWFAAVVSALALAVSRRAPRYVHAAGASRHSRASLASRSTSGQRRLDRERQSDSLRRIHPGPPLLLAACALIGMLVLMVFDPKSAAGGWLIAFVFWSGIPLGSLLAMLIHQLTGGRWGIRFAPAFLPAAAAVPLFAVLIIPVLLALPTFYPWAAGAQTASSDVLHWYLNTPFFIARSLLALCGWTLLAFVPGLAGWPGVLLAALGLCFHALAISAIGLDWILSLEPVFFSTSFGASLAFTQLAQAIAWALLVSPASEHDLSLADLGGLLLATLLGITYLNFMAVLVIWYGDLPRRVFWFVHREGLWMLIGTLAFVIGSVIPILALFLQRIRSSRSGLRAVSTITLVGIALYDAYLIGPPFGPGSLGAALLAILAIGALLTASVGTSWCQARYYGWKAAHAS